jgi:hypothetical protein
MITAQRTLTQDTTSSNEERHINLSQISISQLLGRDYVFVDNRDDSDLFTTPTQITHAIEDLVMRLVLNNSHALFVSINANAAGKATYIRHEVGWHNHRIVKLESKTIADQEQQDFMNMIWNCSSPADMSALEP